MSTAGGWFAADGDGWEIILEKLRRLGPLDREEVVMDLRHFENQVRAKVRAFPSRRELATRWGWSEKRVRVTLARDDWHDPSHPVARDELLDRKGGRFTTTKGPGEGPAEGPVRGPVHNGQTYTIEEERAKQGPGEGPGEGPHARSILEPENQEPGTQLERARGDQLSARPRARTLLSTVWEAINHLYVDSGHGNVALDLDSSGRRASLEKCLRALHKDPLVAAHALVKVLAFWLYGPNDWHRQNLPGSELIAALLRPTKIGANHTKAESWEWDGEVRERAGPAPPSGLKESNFSRQLRELEREWEDEPSGNPTGDLESSQAPPSIRLLQRAP